ncbi:MAG TPA: phosphate ABC transporter substrate-binding protein [Gammaproteobacteria bacterium]|nr:phosphate ABC transporter substrate-binding protein [Gammaproteobacteria bacterium]
MLMSSIVHAEVVVIINPASNISMSNIRAIKKVFLGKTSTLDGKEVSVADQNEGAAVRDEFYQKVARKNAAKLKSYWSKMIFSGKAVPPDVVGDDAAVVAWVANNRNGIGYVDSSAVNDSVKVLLLVP